MHGAWKVRSSAGRAWSINTAEGTTAAPIGAFDYSSHKVPFGTSVSL
ncbi:hypothetical protein Pla123a_05350 [Posidoniimonas polymericola]|uniref:Uncharacterized protein n=1 Tax=Posidoniimonas polymericola TaxID=2528002 RepID=A0A5C5ZEY2_9BACT|nr:hypothetical protein [Posidoniimonas polymericola]TWT85728.1 hypothetical protein Pla123a_05350 [Posidoniimonas polymericola]